jgi:NADH dehydrogenase
MVQAAPAIFVTGATGFVGRRVVDKLLAEGYRVRALVHARPDADERLPQAPAGAEYLPGDVRDRQSLIAAARGCAGAVHLVGILRPRGPDTFHAVHVEGAENVIAACRAAGIGRLVHMSAFGTGRGVPTPYFRTKEAAETAVTASGLEWTILRPTVIHGPTGDFMIRMARMVSRFGPVPLVGAGRQDLQPVWVDDVARTFVKALRLRPTIGQAYNLAGPDVLTLREFYRTLSRVLRGKPKPLVPVPTFLVRAGAWALAKILDDPPVTPDELTMLREARPCDIRPFVEAFDLQPAPFEQTLKDYADELAEAAGLA